MKLIKKFMHTETFSYLVFGGMTTVLNYVLFKIGLLYGFNYKISNLISITVSVIFAYIVNKIFVFKTRCANISLLFKEMYLFFVSRIFTSVLDYIGLIILVSLLKLNVIYSKLFIQAITVVLNYTLSKVVVYKKIES